jgi:hypothetical protein
MSVQNIQIDGTGSFNDSTENAGVVSFATFGDTAVNSGTVSVSAEFSLSAANHGTVTQVAVFVGDAVNTGTVAVAEFKDNAANAGIVSTSAIFADTSKNTGTVAAAEFKNTAVNDGGTVTGAASFADTAENIGSVGGNAVFTGSAENKGSIAGDAVFADTTVNTGSVAGNAQVAATADNSGGTVTGSVSEYTPPSDNSAGYAAWLAGGGSGHYTTGGYNKWAINGNEVVDEAFYNAVISEINTHFGGSYTYLTNNIEFIQWIRDTGGNGQFISAPAYNGSIYENGVVIPPSDNSAANEATFQTWLGSNVGVNQYTGNGLRNGTWAYNSTVYASQADAIVAANAEDNDPYND